MFNPRISSGKTIFNRSRDLSSLWRVFKQPGADSLVKLSDEEKVEFISNIEMIECLRLDFLYFSCLFILDLFPIYLSLERGMTSKQSILFNSQPEIVNYENSEQ